MSQTAENADWNFPVPVSFGAGRIADLPELMKAAGVSRPLVVCDKGGGDRHQITAILQRGGLTPPLRRRGARGHAGARGRRVEAL